MATWPAVLVTALSAIPPQISDLEDCLKPPPASRQRLPEQIAAWRPGRPIPPEALRFQAICGCLADPTDSAVILREAENYEFLVTLATHPKADPAVMEMAINRALELRGPSAVYMDLVLQYQSLRWLLNLWPHKVARARMQMRNVWASAISSSRTDAGREVLEEIAGRIRAGEDFHSIVKEYQTACEVGARGPRVGYYGVYVAPETRDEAIAGRGLMVPTSMMPALLAATAGDILVLKQGRFGDWILWQVHEVYVPPVDRAYVPPVDRAQTAPGSNNKSRNY